MQTKAFFSLPGPLDALPAPGQMRAANLQGIGDMLGKMGVSSRRVLERFEINERAVSDPDFLVDCRSVGGLFEYCSERFDRPLFGLELAGLQSPDVFGLVMAVCRAAPTVADALDCFVAYLPVVHSPVSNVELVKGEQVCELRFGGNATVHGLDDRQIMFEASLLIVRLMREIGGTAFQPLYVYYANPVRAADVPEIERICGCPLRSSQGVNAVAFPASLLSRRVPGASRPLFQLLQGYLEQVRLSRRTTLVERLEDCVRSSFESGKCSADWCAKKLGMSPRALRVRLAQLDLRFSDIVEQQRISLALDYLAQPGKSLDEVAFALGYAEQSSFGRAFKRWTGRTPQAQRAMQGRDASA